MVNIIKFSIWLEEKRACGDCFRFANNLAREMLGDGIIEEREIKVCHGLVVEPLSGRKTRHIHAWVETNDRCYDWQMNVAGTESILKKDFYELYKPTNIKKYSVEDSMINMVKNKHHGPWE